MSYIGDYALGSTVVTKFTTVATTGAPTTLTGGVVSAYVDSGTTEITAGITLNLDFDSRTGMHNLSVVASGGNGFAAGTNVQLVITTGTVGGTSAVGYVVGEFSIENRSGLRPTTAGRTLDVSATGEAGIDWANVGSPTTTLNLSGTSTKAVEPTVAGRTLDVASTGEAGLDFANINIYAAGPFAPTGVVDSGTAQSATGTTLVLRAAAAFADSELVGATIVIRSATTGAGQRRLITANVGATDTCTVDTWTTTPTGTIVYDIFGSPPGSATAPIQADVIKWNGTAVSSPATAGIPDVNVKNIDNDAASASGTVTFPNATLASTTGAVGSVTGAVGSVTGAVGSVTGNVGGNVTGTVGSVVGAVGSVTGNVGGNVTGSVGSVVGAVGSVTGAVGSVTGNVGGNVTGTVGSVVGAVGSVTGNVGGNVVGSVASVTATVNADLKKINGTTVLGDGAGTPWGP